MGTILMTMECFIIFMAHIILSLTYQRKKGIEDSFVIIWTLHVCLVITPRFILFWVAHCTNVGKSNLSARWWLAYTYLATTVIWVIMLIVADAITFSTPGREYQDAVITLSLIFFFSVGLDT